MSLENTRKKHMQVKQESVVKWLTSHSSDVFNDNSVLQRVKRTRKRTLLGTEYDNEIAKKKQNCPIHVKTTAVTADSPVAVSVELTVGVDSDLVVAVVGDGGNAFTADSPAAVSVEPTVGVDSGKVH